jgi:N-dimethylarginine dimethylaminohydrolase
MLFPHGTWLLCPPTFFDVEYEINPWMDVDVTPDKIKSPEQWKTLHHTLIRLGAFVEYIEPTRGNPDLVFTANAGLIKGKKIILSHFKFKERQGEEPLFRKWFEHRGYQIIEIPTSLSFEGEGDALFAGETLFCGYGFRSDIRAYDFVAENLEIKNLVLCELINPRFYHLDTCFCPLNSEKAIFVESAFSKESINRMEQSIDLHPVPQIDAEHFVCNAVVLGNNIVLPAECEKTYALLSTLGFTSHPVQLGEFLKGGGSAKCLTLRIDRN